MCGIMPILQTYKLHTSCQIGETNLIQSKVEASEPEELRPLHRGAGAAARTAAAGGRARAADPGHS